MSGLHLVIGNKNYSSWSLRPWIAMKMAGIPFRETIIPVLTPQFASQVSKHSPAGKVPVLHHGKITVWDSLAILEYLAETFPEKNLWPKTKAARAYARSICSEMHSGFNALRSTCPMNLRRPKKSVPMSDAVKADIVRIERIWKECRKTYGKDGTFLFGKFTIADAMFLPVATRFDTYGISISKESREYADHVMRLKPFLEWKKEGLKEAWIIPANEVA
jgi:glutathione S-transferase